MNIIFRELSNKSSVETGNNRTFLFLKMANGTDTFQSGCEIVNPTDR